MGKRTLASKIRKLAYYKWEDAGRPAGDGVNFWLEAENEIVNDTSKPVTFTPRYIAVKGVTVIKQSNTLFDIMSQVALTHDLDHCDVVIWDTGTVQFPQMTVVASTCRGWLPVKVKGRDYIPEDFGVSFTPSEMGVLKRLFDQWVLEGDQTVTNVIKHLYDQCDLKNVSVHKDLFKTLISKLLKIVEVKNGSTA